MSAMSDAFVPVNEDSAWIRHLEQGYILGIVADGMGGHLAGDTA